MKYFKNKFLKIPFTTASKIKYFIINLTKEVKDTCDKKNYKILMKEMEEHINK